jgi:hypothetical protein
LVAVASMLEGTANVSLLDPTTDQLAAKIDKVMKYLALSQALGQVEII